MPASLKSRWLTLPAMLLLAACSGGNEKPADATPPSPPEKKSYWEGKAESPPEQYAQKMCNCVESRFKSAGVDIEKMRKVDKAQIQRDAMTLTQPEMDKKYSEYNEAMTKLNGQQTAYQQCVESIMQEAVAQNVDLGKLGDAFALRCALAGL